MVRFGIMLQLSSNGIQGVRSVYVKVKLHYPERPMFQRLYICLDACKKGFLEGCRPIIGLDGCHLKGAYTGQILVAVAKDGNENIFPVAYAVVEAERKETWVWFLENLIKDLGDASITFMSDRQKVKCILINKNSSVTIFLVDLSNTLSLCW